MTPRSKLISLVCSLVVLCSVASVRKPTAVHQGRGAADLIAKRKAVASTVGLMPNLVVAPPKPVTFWFTATAWTYDDWKGYLESDPTPSMAYVRTNQEQTVSLAWDLADVDGYKIQWWLATKALTNIVDVGNVTNATIRIVPLPLTNVCITVTGSTNWTMTNPPASSMFFTGRNLTISKRYF